MTLIGIVAQLAIYSKVKWPPSIAILVVLITFGPEDKVIFLSYKKRKAERDISYIFGTMISLGILLPDAFIKDTSL